MIIKYILILISPFLLFFIGMAPENDLQDKINFSHSLHIVDQELECTTCHINAETSTTGQDDLLPIKDVCADCHDVEAKDECSTCHTNVENAVKLPRMTQYSTLFSHEKHIAKELNCETCHGDVSQNQAGQQASFPDMVVCMDCHRSNSVSQGQDCYTCHTKDEQLKPATHNLAFMHSHSDMAPNNINMTSGSKTCNTCHSPQYCEDCHNGENIDRSIHPLNFEFTHALAAQSKTTDCTSCHEDQSFCNSCHVQNNLMPQNHTAGWTNRIPGDGGRHSFEASIDLENCMSCHERNAEQICQQCHSK
jgi:hypothetical protein